METKCTSCADIKVPVKEIIEADVAVIGGGPAGIAAAEAAGRSGLSVVLLEQNGFLGGQAVGGLSATICGLYLTNEEWTRHNGPKQIVFGFAERFRQKMIKLGGLTEPQLYGNTYVDAHEPFAWKCAAEELLEEAGVKIMYHTSVSSARVEGDSIKEVLANTADGEIIVRAKRFVDASGDGALVAASGAEYRIGVNGVVQNPSFIFKLSNVDEEKFWDYYGENTICHDEFSDKIREAEKAYGEELPRKKIWIFRTVNCGELYINATTIAKPNGSNLNCLDVDDISYAEIMGRKQGRTYAKFLKEYIPGCENSHIGEHASNIGVRQTRSAVCLKSLKNSDVENCVKPADGVVRSSWPIELHRGEAPKLYWLTNDYYEIPFGAMVVKAFKNLLVAGRNIDAEHEALASSRVTAQCFEMGHAAGLASALSRKKNINFHELDGREVRKALNEDDARLD